MEIQSNLLLGLYLFLFNLLVFVVARSKRSTLLAYVLSTSVLMSFLSWLFITKQNGFEIVSGSLLAIATFINAFRLKSNIYPRTYISEQSKRTLINISLLTLIWFSLLTLIDIWDFTFLVNIYVAITSLLALLIFFKISTFLMSDSPAKINNQMGFKLPTVTIAIPARNEDAVLENSLHKHLKSSYPKLEIIVLDDCSHDSTAQIIKSFAHQGMRFIQGQNTARTWLGKNYAYQQLLEAASGELILFCGADIHISKHALNELVHEFRSQDLKMLAILPSYQPIAADSNIWGVGQQITRYFWQLGITDLLSSTPPIVGSCWLINKAELEKLGGFKAFKQAIEPERLIASRIALNGSYNFMPARNLKSEIISTKRSKEQAEHIKRVAYPLLKRSISVTLLATYASIAFLIMPFVGLINMFGSTQLNYTWLVLAASGAILITAFLTIYWFSAHKYLYSGLLMLPIMLLQMPLALLSSMFDYEMHGLDWKDRNICIPPIDIEFKRPKKKRGRRRGHRN